MPSPAMCCSAVWGDGRGGGLVRAQVVPLAGPCTLVGRSGRARHGCGSVGPVGRGPGSLVDCSGLAALVGLLLVDRFSKDVRVGDGPCRHRGVRLPGSHSPGSTLLSAEPMCR